MVCGVHLKTITWAALVKSSPKNIRSVALSKTSTRLNSHRKAAAAIKAGKFVDEIVPVEIPQKKGAAILFAEDETVREDTTVETLSKLKPAFKKDGTVTAGNAPSVNDGASAVVVTSLARAKQLGVEPMARIVAQATSGVEPRMVMMAPVEAVQKAVEEDWLVWKRS